MGDISFGEMILIGIVAILLYGKNLPQVARKAAQFYSKIRRHLNDIKDEISRQIPPEDVSVDLSSPSTSYYGGAPPPPTGLTATVDQNTVILSWDTSPQADYYNLKRTSPPEGTYSTIATSLSSTSYTDTPPFDGSTVSYVVTASNSYGESGDSIEATVYLPGAPPADPAPGSPPPAPASGAPPEAPAPAEAPPAEARAGDGAAGDANAPSAPPAANPEVPRML